MAITSAARSLAHRGQAGQVDERRRPDPPPDRLASAVGDQVIAQLALGILHPHVHLTRRRLHSFHHLLEVKDHGFHVAHGPGLGRKHDPRVGDVDGSALETAQPDERLLQNPIRLGHLLHPHPVAIVDVAVFAHGDVEVVAVVVQVRPVLSNVVVYRAGPEHRPGQREVDGLVGRECAHALRPPDPDGVAGEHGVHFRQRCGEGAGELAETGFPAIRDVRHHAADPGQAGGEPGTSPRFLEVVDPLPLLERPEEWCEGAQVDPRRPQPYQMGDDPAHFAGDHPKHLAPLGDLDPINFRPRARSRRCSPSATGSRCDR